MLNCQHIKTFEDAEMFISKAYDKLGDVNVDWPTYHEYYYEGKRANSSLLTKYRKLYDEIQSAIKYLKNRGVYWEERDSEDIYT